MPHLGIGHSCAAVVRVLIGSNNHGIGGQKEQFQFHEYMHLWVRQLDQTCCLTAKREKQHHQIQNR